MHFHYNPDQALWKSESTVRLLGSDLEVWLEDETGEGFDSQQRILTYALETLPTLDGECRQQLFQYYKSACEDFPDLVGTEHLPVIAGIEGLPEIFGFSILEIPEQIDGRGITLKIAGNCKWNAEDGVQLFFRDGVLEHVDSDAAWYF